MIELQALGTMDRHDLDGVCGAAARFREQVGKQRLQIRRPPPFARRHALAERGEKSPRVA